MRLFILTNISVELVFTPVDSYTVFVDVELKVITVVILGLAVEVFVVVVVVIVVLIHAVVVLFEIIGVSTANWILGWKSG